MECLKGKSVYKGVAFGKISVLKKDDYVVKRVKIEDTQAELQRVEEAVEASKQQLQKLYEKALKEVGEASAAIFEVHQMMLEDEDYKESIENIISTQQVNAEYAVASTVCPHFTARDINAISLDASTVLPSFVIVILLSYFFPSFASIPAGLAWIPISSLIVYSNFFILLSPFVLTNFFL